MSVSKIEAFCRKYALALDELVDFLSFYKDVGKSLPPESLSAMEDLIDQHVQSIHGSHGYVSTDQGVHGAIQWGLRAQACRTRKKAWQGD